MSLNIFYIYSETHTRSIQVSGFSDRAGLRLHLAFAVDTLHGLMVPVIRDSDKMSIPELSLEFLNAPGPAGFVPKSLAVRQ